MFPPIVFVDETKMAALEREIICEVTDWFPPE
jgi:hypothetical protein